MSMYAIWQRVMTTCTRPVGVRADRIRLPDVTHANGEFVYVK